MKGNGSAKITELTVSISFSQRLTVGREGKKNPDKRNHGSRASAKKI